jgi:hypothetical protein
MSAAATESDWVVSLSYPIACQGTSGIPFHYLLSTEERPRADSPTGIAEAFPGPGDRPGQVPREIGRNLQYKQQRGNKITV